MIEGLTPRQIVAKLDEFIIGQIDAKKAVAIALRNRQRRMSLGDNPLKEEIHPKNIIMIGPTGVGKTEIARRLAKLSNAPFLKVEATKYTEVGYVGRDVESMIRDLTATSLKMVQAEYAEKVKETAEKRTEERILDILVPVGNNEKPTGDSSPDEEEKMVREIFRKKLKAGQFEDKEIEIKTQQQSPQAVVQMMAVPGLEDLENQMQNLLGDMLPRKKEKRKIPVTQARKIILQEETENLLDFEKIKAEAVQRTENTGIIFIDEIDKIASRGSKGSPDVSREGVQRDILPLVEGSAVNTKYGVVHTDHILFIAAGAFHIASVSDLIPELQGRFPIRVELKPLVKDDYISILKNPRNALSKQYQALLSTENIALEFEPGGYETLAEMAFTMNARNENIGARRLHTIMEKMLETISFEPENFQGKEVRINSAFVNSQLSDIVQNQDLSKFIL